ncbi:MAG: hypothetical protein O2794_00480 [bacterium]|nr:hypothetical protein [bacterium]
MSFERAVEDSARSICNASEANIVSFRPQVYGPESLYVIRAFHDRVNDQVAHDLDRRMTKVIEASTESDKTTCLSQHAEQMGSFSHSVSELARHIDRVRQNPDDREARESALHTMAYLQALIDGVEATLAIHEQ